MYDAPQVLGALASVLSIWLVTGILVYEAVNRVFNPVRVEGKRERPRCGCPCTENPVSETGSRWQRRTSHWGRRRR